MAKGFISDDEMSAMEATQPRPKGFISDEEMDLREKAFAPLPSVESIAKSKIKPWESVVQGAASSMAFGLDNELAGVASGIKAAVTLNNPIDAYNETSRAVEESKRAYKEANPLSHMAGSVVGGFTAPGIGAVKGASLLKNVGTTTAANVGMGAVSRAADGEGIGRVKDALDPTSLAIDTGLGVVFGAGGHALGKTAKAASTPVETAKTANSMVQVGKKAFEETSGDGKLGAVKGALNAYKAAKEIPALKAEAKAVANEGRAFLAKTAEMKGQPWPGSSHDMSDEDVVTALLMEGGEHNPINKFIANTAATTHGGSVQSDDYTKLLSVDPSVSAKARRFDRAEAGEELVDGISDSYGSIKDAAGKRYEQLQGQAREAFTPQGSDAVNEISSLSKSLQADKTISANVRNILDKGVSKLTDGDAPWTQLSPQDQFDRLQEAGRYYQKAVKWSSQNELPEGQEALQQAWGMVKSRLHALEDMKTADKGYSTFKDLEKNLFEPLGNKVRGKITDFDPIKVEKLFSGSASGRKLAKQVERAREALKSGSLSDEQAEVVKATLAKLDDMQSLSDLKKFQGNFKMKTVGVSGMATERLGSIARKDSLLDSAVRTPNSFLGEREEVATQAAKLLGKPLNEASMQEKVAIAKYNTWLRANQKAPAQERAKVWSKLSEGFNK